MGAVSITMICIAAVVLVGILVFSFFLLHKKKFNSTFKNLRKTYDTYHSLLVNCEESMLKRLKVLGDHNSTFSEIYLERRKQYDDITNKRDEDIRIALDSLDTLVKEKNYKEYKRVEEETSKALDLFMKAVLNFRSDLSSILQEDNDVHSNAVAIKGKYRDIKNFVDAHQSELKPLMKPFDKIFSRSEEQFAEFEKMADEVNYDSAKKILIDLGKLYDAILQVMNELPSLEVLVTTVIPNKLDSLEKEYHTMVEEDYVVNEMHVEEKVSSMRKEIEEIQAQLMYLDIRGVKDKLSAIQTKITDILAGFEEERNAKEIYLSRQNSLSDSSFSVEKRYSRLMNSLSEYQRTFLLDEKYVTQMKVLKADIESIGILKRELDSYLDTSAKKPYVVITKKMTEMDNEMKKTIKVMDDYSDYLKSLKEDSSYVFTSLKDDFVKLKKIQNEVRNLRVNSYYSTVSKVFEDDFKTIREINSILCTTPINVLLAKSKFIAFNESLDGFIHSINMNVEEANKAEAAIVYANAYRVDYQDARPILNQAEQAFVEGDFARATSLACKVVQKFSIGSLAQ